MLEDLANAKVVLFGAGRYGMDLFNRLNQSGIVPSYFVDNYQNAKREDSIPIAPPKMLLGEDKSRLKIIISLGEPWHEQVKQQLETMGLHKCIYNPLTTGVELLMRLPASLPSTVGIDASTLCQLRCADCISHKPDNGRILGSGYLKFVDFKNFVDNHPFVRAIELSNFGEIFLNPELSVILEYAYIKNVTLRANNGVNFNDASNEAIEALVKFKLESMTISIDGASQETYSTYRINGDYNRVLKNIQKINSFKKHYDSEFPKLTWQFIIMHHNEDDVTTVKEFARKLNMNIFFKLTWNAGYKPMKVDMLKNVTGLKQLTANEYIESNAKPYLPEICNQLWLSPQINWDGRLLGCCGASKKDFGVNVFDIGLKNALDSQSYKYAKLLLQGKITADDVHECRDNIPCLDCNVYKRRVEHNSFIEIA